MITHNEDKGSISQRLTKVLHASMLDYMIITLSNSFYGVIHFMMAGFD
jgi:hypothetical protein